MTDKPQIKMISPPLQPGHPCRFKNPGLNPPGDPMTLIATWGDWAWVQMPGGALETVNFLALVTDLPDVQAVELTPEQMDDRIKRAKLAQVQHLVKVIARNDQAALDEMIHRLKLAYKGRIILDPKDDATPEQMAQGLLVSVLMAALEVAS